MKNEIIISDGLAISFDPLSVSKNNATITLTGVTEIISRPYIAEAIEMAYVGIRLYNPRYKDWLGAHLRVQLLDGLDKTYFNLCGKPLHFGPGSDSPVKVRLLEGISGDIKQNGPQYDSVLHISVKRKLLSYKLSPADDYITSEYDVAYPDHNRTLTVNQQAMEFGYVINLRKIEDIL